MQAHFRLARFRRLRLRISRTDLRGYLDVGIINLLARFPRQRSEQRAIIHERLAIEADFVSIHQADDSARAAIEKPLQLAPSCPAVKVARITPRTQGGPARPNRGQMAAEHAATGQKQSHARHLAGITEHGF
jgi:hypothetical protein